MKAKTLAQTLAKLLRAGFKPIFLDNAPLDAELYGAGWGVYIFEKNGTYWQAAVDTAKRVVVVAKL